MEGVAVALSHSESVPRGYHTTSLHTTPHHTTHTVSLLSVQVHDLHSGAGHEPLSDAAGGRLSAATGCHTHAGLSPRQLDLGPAQEVVD